MVMLIYIRRIKQTVGRARVQPSYGAKEKGKTKMLNKQQASVLSGAVGHYLNNSVKGFFEGNAFKTFHFREMAESTLEILRDNTIKDTDGVKNHDELLKRTHFEYTLLGYSESNWPDFLDKYTDLWYDTYNKMMNDRITHK